MVGVIGHLVVWLAVCGGHFSTTADGGDQAQARYPDTPSPRSPVLSARYPDTPSPRSPLQPWSEWYGYQEQACSAPFQMPATPAPLLNSSLAATNYPHLEPALFFDGSGDSSSPAGFVPQGDFSPLALPFFPLGKDGCQLTPPVGLEGDNANSAPLDRCFEAPYVDSGGLMEQRLEMPFGGSEWQGVDDGAWEGPPFDAGAPPPFDVAEPRFAPTFFDHGPPDAPTNFDGGELALLSAFGVAEAGLGARPMSDVADWDECCGLAEETLQRLHAAAADRLLGSLLEGSSDHAKGGKKLNGKRTSARKPMTVAETKEIAANCKSVEYIDWLIGMGEPESCDDGARNPTEWPVPKVADEAVVAGESVGCAHLPNAEPALRSAAASCATPMQMHRLRAASQEPASEGGVFPPGLNRVARSNNKAGSNDHLPDAYPASLGGGRLFKTCRGSREQAVSRKFGGDSAASAGGENLDAQRITTGARSQPQESTAAVTDSAQKAYSTTGYSKGRQGNGASARSRDPGRLAAGFPSESHEALQECAADHGEDAWGPTIGPGLRGQQASSALGQSSSGSKGRENAAEVGDGKGVKEPASEGGVFRPGLNRVARSNNKTSSNDHPPDAYPTSLGGGRLVKSCRGSREQAVSRKFGGDSAASAGGENLDAQRITTGARSQPQESTAAVADSAQKVYSTTGYSKGRQGNGASARSRDLGRLAAGFPSESHEACQECAAVQCEDAWGPTIGPVGHQQACSAVGQASSGSQGRENAAEAGDGKGVKELAKPKKAKKTKWTKVDLAAFMT